MRLQWKKKKFQTRALQLSNLKFMANFLWMDFVDGNTAREREREMSVVKSFEQDKEHPEWN